MANRKVSEELSPCWPQTLQPTVVARWSFFDHGGSAKALVKELTRYDKFSNKMKNMFIKVGAKLGFIDGVVPVLIVPGWMSVNVSWRRRSSTGTLCMMCSAKLARCLRVL